MNFLQENTTVNKTFFLAFLINFFPKRAIIIIMKKYKCFFLSIKTALEDDNKIMIQSVRSYLKDLGSSPTLPATLCHRPGQILTQGWLSCLVGKRGSDTNLGRCKEASKETLSSMTTWRKKNLSFANK